MIAYDSRCWFSLLFRWRGSVVPRIWFELVLSVGFGFLAYYADNAGVELVRLVDFLGYDASDITLPVLDKGEVLDEEIHSLIMLPIGFLLIFRTFIAYSRFWSTQEMMRLISAYSEGDEEEAQVERAELRRLINMLYAVAREHIEPTKRRMCCSTGCGMCCSTGHGASNSLEHLSMITPSESEVLEPITNRVSIVAQWFAFRLSESVRVGRMSRNDVRVVDSRVHDFVRAWAGCARLVSTPVPYPYVQMLNLLLLFYVYSAPFTFAHRFGGQVVEEDSEMVLRQRDPDTEKFEKFWGKRAFNQRLLREETRAELRQGSGVAPRGGVRKVGVDER
ncbi:Bestrophin, RFP-TM, chloride channel-domain-containing protein [Pavlovales sp. CCMP2436]|nr:Bestrophin, RFP-TM, chloride channel-domain-containing protein [Pavlovales sp. CCMP2436]